MKIGQLMKLHYVYLFSKKNMIAILICLIIGLAISLYSWLDNVSLALPSEQIIELSWQTIFTFDKLILHTIAVFIMGNFCLPENDQYYCLFIFQKVSRNKFFIVKMFVLMMVIVVFATILFISFVISGYLLNHYFVMQFFYVKAFVYCLLSSLVFGFFTIFLVKLFPTVMSIIISMIIFLASDMFADTIIIGTIFPTITTEYLKNTSPISLILLIILLLFYLFIAIVVNYSKK